MMLLLLLLLAVEEEFLQRPDAMFEPPGPLGALVSAANCSCVTSLPYITSPESHDQTPVDHDEKLIGVQEDALAVE